MQRLILILVAVLVGALAGWSAAYINATSAPLDRNALSDRMARQIKADLAKIPQLRTIPLDIAVEVDRQLVTISGLVTSETRHQQVLELLTKLQAGLNVSDKILVLLPRQEFTVTHAERQRAAARATGELVGLAVSDAWIHSNLSARLRTQSAATFQFVQIDVVDGKVTLRGLVSSSEQKIAAGQVAAATEGVAVINNRLKTVIEPGKAYRIAVG